MQQSFWNEQQEEVRWLLNSGNRALFRVWDPVRRIPLYEPWHWVGYMQGVIDTSERLAGDRRERWIEAMAPRRWGFDDEFYRRTELRLRLYDKEIVTTTYNAKSNHHLESYYQMTGRDLLSHRRIVEFGGGTGDLARLAMDLGYDGEYVIVDLPEMLGVQTINFADARCRVPVLATETPGWSPDTALVSTWALSEVPVALREEVIGRLRPDSWLIVTQRSIFGVDNDAYFSGWKGERRELEWIRWDGGSYYIAK